MPSLNIIQRAALGLFLEQRTIEQAAYIIKMSDQARRDKVPNDTDYECSILIRDTYKLENYIDHSYDFTFETMVKFARVDLCVDKAKKKTFGEKFVSFLEQIPFMGPTKKKTKAKVC